MSKTNNGANLGFENQMWAAADKLRGHMDASEYKHVVLGLIFLKYISDAFQAKYKQLEATKDTEYTDPEDRDEYSAANIFWVPKEARWAKLQASAKQPTIGKLIDDAMVAIEKENVTLRGVLPKDYGRPSLDKRRLGGLIDIISKIGLGDEGSRSRDILGRVYEYFLGRFAAAEGKGGGEFYTPQCVVKLLVRMLEPYKGRVFDPCCGSDGKKRYLTEVTALSKAFALAVPHEEALKIRDKVGFFQEVRAGLAKATVEGEGKSPEEMDTAIRQLVSRAVASEEVIDIFAAAGLKKPDISILSDDFLQEVRQLPHRNLAVESLRKLLNDEIKTNSRKNVVKARSFAEMLEKAIRKYQNRAIEAAQVIEELIKLAKEMREAQQRGDDLGMTDDEIAFYDALEVNDSAVKVLGDETLKTIAHELVESVRRSVTIDWTVRENARAQMRVIVKRILRKYGYPPDKQKKATQTILEQAEVLCKEWAES